MSKKNKKTGKTSYSTKTTAKIALAAGSGLSFLFIVTAVFSLLLFSHIKTLIENEAREFAITKAVNLNQSFYNTQDPEHITTSDFDTKDILELIITRPTRDERFVRCVNHLPLVLKSPDQAIPFSEKTDTPFNGEVHFFEKGKYEITVDPTIYRTVQRAWHNVYFPYTQKDPASGKEELFIIRASVSISQKNALLSRYSSWLSIFLTALLVISTLTFIILMLLTLQFFQGIRLFFHRMGIFARLAVSGESYNIISEHDEDFAPIAESFNTLVDGIKEKEAQLESYKNKNRQNYDELFKQGVSLLKEKKLSEAEHVFKAMTIIKPVSFGSWFNLGVIYAKNGHYSEAVEMFDEALQINPEDSLSATYKMKIEKLIGRTTAHAKIS